LFCYIKPYDDTEMFGIGVQQHFELVHHAVCEMVRILQDIYTNEKNENMKHGMVNLVNQLLIGQGKLYQLVKLKIIRQRYIFFQ